MADEMDENLSSNDETRVRLPRNVGRCTKQSSKRKYKSKKRTFHGNRYSKSSTHKSSSKVVNKTLTRKNFDRLSNKIRDAADHKTQPGGSAYIGVSVDGTWQKPGFCSLNGVVAAISVTNGKVLDVETRHCKSCTSNAPLKDPHKYETWSAQYKI